MTKISFTKKYIIISILLAASLTILVMILWGTLVRPKVGQVGQLEKQVTTLTVEIEGEQEKVEELQDLPALLETTMVTEKPTIPNGMSLSEYFQGLAKKNTVSLLQMTFDDQAIMPSEEGEGASVSENQIRSLTMSFDVLSNTEAELLSFIEQLETDDRLTKVNQVMYRHTPSSEGQSSLAYSSTISLNMYYLSKYETGQPFSEKID